MKFVRPVLFFMLLGCIVAMIGLFIAERHQLPFVQTVSPLFQLLGKPIKSFDRAVSKLTPVSDIDEKMLGDELKAQLGSYFTIKHDAVIEQAYLNSLIKNLTSNTRKQFEYSVYFVEGPPNACALPGGVICVTDQLLEVLTTEAELVAILSHEIGHIERGHLFDAARSEMLRRKIKECSLITYAVDTIRLFTTFCHSKTQEDEADEYGFRMLLEKGYNPFAMSSSLQSLLGQESLGESTTNFYKDFFSSHPHLEIRINKFRSLAERWVANHSDIKMYVGRRNLKEKQSRYDVSYAEESEYGALHKTERLPPSQ